MKLPQEQLTQIRKQLVEQINTTFPEEKKAETIKQIEEMDNEQLIKFLKQNNLINSKKEGDNSNQQCIFCSIVFGDLPSTKIAENEKAIAILELNPISNGHTLIIPKEHITNRNAISKEVYDLAKDVGEKIKSTFQPTEIKVLEGEIMNHQIINILPIYNNETMESPRQKQTPENLAKLKQKIDSSQIEQINLPEKQEEVQGPKIEEINKTNTWLPKRKP